METEKKLCVLVVVILFFSSLVSAGKVEGELKVWHKVTLSFDGPQTSEQATPNPFTGYRLDVTFTGPSGQTYVVPGYYAANGDAANSSADVGNQWRAHLAPEENGKWQWKASFRKGNMVAVDGDPQAGQPAGYMDGKKGSFEIQASDKTGRDFRGKGMLQYVGKHHLQFTDSKEFFLKQGADAPENLLAYADFDGDFKTDGQKDNLIKTWQPHVKDWQPGDPTWADGKGKGLIGAINYLASEGLNAFSFLTMNIDGDDRNVFPYLNYNERLRMDVSRLAQWEVVFEHADNLGMYLHFKTQETENDQLLDKGELGVERKLYYRELIARFGHHLALNWNLGEENTNTTEQLKAFCKFFKDNDPYNHPVVLHTFPGQHDQVYGPLLGNASELTGLSIQTSKSDFKEVHDVVRTWVAKSQAAGKPWVVACDEPGDASRALLPDKDDPTHDNPRKYALWGTLMAGGAGNEWYFGYKFDHSDLTCQDFRSRDLFWDQCRYALEFFHKQQIAFWEMNNKNDLTWQDNDYCFVKDGQIYLIYQTQGGPLNLDLAEGRFEYGYFNPRTGEGAEVLLNETQVAGPKQYTFKAPDDKDWLLVIRSKDGGTVTQSEKPQMPKAAAIPDGAMVISAIDDFTSVQIEGLVEAYKDTALKAMAINAKKYKDKFAAVEAVYNGKKGTFSVILTALTETDGESTYKLFVNSKQIGSAQNPVATEDYQPVYHVWDNVQLNKGDTIQVHFNSASNGKFPEGDGFAYSRGRWSTLTIGDAAAAKELKASAPAGKQIEVNIIKIESLYKGQVFEEKDGFLAVEAEFFSEQSKTDKRKWYITTTEGSSGITPDGDPSHAADASGGAYIEILPDIQRKPSQADGRQEPFAGV